MMKQAFSMLGLPGLMLGAATLAPTIVHAQAADETIIVEGHWHHGRVPEDADNASQVVSYADLDLSTDWGRGEFKHRVRLAARYLCDRLGESDTASAGVPTCRDAAYHDAMERLGTVEQHFAPRGTAWVKPAPWTAPWTADWAARYPDEGN